MRKRLALLMASLFLIVGAVWAQIPVTSTAPADGQWNANTRWYTIQCNDGGKGYISLSYVDANGNLLLNNSTKPTTAHGFWCVVGDDANGYQFYNMATGTTKVLGATGSQDGGRMKMYDATGGVNGVTYKFDIKKLDGQDGYAFVKNQGSENDWWNHRGDYLAYWNTSLAYDAGCVGSQYVFTEVSSDELATLAESYKTSALEVLNSLSTLFDVEAIQVAITKVNTADATALGTIISEFEKIGNKRIAFRNGDPDHANRKGAYLAVRPNREKGHGTQAHANWSNIVWSLKYIGGTTFALYNEVHELYLGAPSSEGALSATPTTGYTFEIVEEASKKVEIKWGGQTLHLNNHSDGKLSNHDNNDNASRWYIETDLSGRIAEYKAVTANAELIANAKTLVADSRLASFANLAQLNAAIANVEGSDLVVVVKAVAELTTLVPAAKDYIREFDVTPITALDFTKNSNHPVIVNNKRSNWGVAADPTGLNTLAELGLAKSSTDTKQQFAFITPNGKDYYLYSVHAQRYLKSDNTFSTQGEPVAFADASSKGENKVQVRFRDVAQKYFNVGGDNQMTIDYWDTIDDGNACEIVQYNTLEFDLEYALRIFNEGADLTIKYMYGDELKHTEKVLAWKNTEHTIALPWGYTSIESCTVGGNDIKATGDTWKFTVTSDAEVIVRLAYKMPFTVSQDFDNAVWHVMRVRPVRSGKEEFNWISKSETEPYTYSQEVPTTDEGLWAFVGNPFEGFKIYNKAADENSTLGVNGSNVVVKEGEKIWTVGKCIESGNLRGFYLYEGTDNKYAHDLGGKLQIWNSSSAPTDGGSAFLVYHPLTIKYMYEDEEVEELNVNTYVAPGAVYTIRYKEEMGEKEIVSCKIGDEEIPVVRGAWPVTVNAPTTVVVTLEIPTPAPTDLYALQSVNLADEQDKDGETYFNFTPITTQGTTTAASFQSTPSFLYKKFEENNGYYLQNLEDEEKFVGANHKWLVTTEKAYWTVSEPDAEGLVTISRKADAKQSLGHDGNTKVNTGIYTNVASENCNKWKLIPAYPVTLNYVCNEEVIETVKTGVISGASYTAELDTKGGTFISCVADEGVAEITNGLIFIRKVIAPITITVTLEDAQVSGFLQISGWTVGYDPAVNGIKLLDVTGNGNETLEIASQYEINGKMQDVVAISPTFMHNNTTVESVTLPATLTNLGFRKVEPLFIASYEGQPGDFAKYNGTTVTSQQGMNRCLVFPNDPKTGQPYMVGQDFAWRLTLDVTIDDPSINFNQWGSSIVSTYENSLADSYVGYMQIYMQAGHKNIVVRLDNADDRYKYNTKVLDGEGNETAEDLVMTNFKFELEHDGSGGYQVVIYYENGKAKMYNIKSSKENKVKDFDRLYYSLPEGVHVDVKLDKLVSDGLFVGCTNLKEIIVDDANPAFKNCEHGVLYDKQGYYVMRIPEGETDHHFEIPSKVVKLYAGAVHGVSADIVLHSNPQIGVVEGHEEHVENAKFYLSLDDIDNTITSGEVGYLGARDFTSANTNTYQSANYKRAPLAEGVYGTICLPFAPTNALEKYDFFKFKYGDATSLTFSQVTELEANEPYLYKLKENPVEMDQDKDGKDVFKSESGKTVTIKTKDKYDPKQHKPGTCDALGSFVNYYVETAKYPNSAFYYYSLGQSKFLKVTQELTYRPYRAFFVVTPEVGGASQAPARLSLCLLDGTTTDIDASLVEGMETPVYYDLSGRRVLNPGSGVYIVNGKKVFIK